MIEFDPKYPHGIDTEYDDHQALKAETAYERDCASRLARERERDRPFGSEPLTAGQTASDEEGRCLLPDWDRHMAQLHRAIDDLEAGVQRIKRFLGVTA